MTERDLFIAALQKDDPEQRRAFLEAACAGRPGLRQQIEDLLRLQEQAGSFLQGHAASAVTGAFVPSPAEQTLAAAEQPGTVLGPYKLLEQIGEGGFGVVFMAEQHEPLRRKVALKVLKPGMDTGQVLARFEAERQALALMDHPNIARVLDAGQSSGGRPYFVMELVRGVPVTQFCDDNRLSTQQRLELFVEVCSAVQHAHTKGIIHRDIKPSNVLVTLHDGQPLVKVIDFGIAKALGQQLTERTLFTGFAQMIGTPLYMSPEQAGLCDQDVDTRSDVYSLGVLLYELLTGTTPLEKERLSRVGYDEMRRIIREEEPPRPSTRLSTLGQAASTISTRRQSDPKQLSKLFRGELDWVVMKALDKDRSRRYESASDFARDVQRYLDDEPVLACPPSMSYRLGKFLRRNRTALAVTTLVLFFLILLLGGGGWVIWDRWATRQETLERRQRLTTRGESILLEEEQLEREQKWPQALAAAERAEEALAGGEVDDAVRQRARDVRQALAFVARLDRIRQKRGEELLEGEDTQNNRTAVRDYGQAFQGYGVDVEALTAAEAAARLRARPALVVPIAAALDDWKDALFRLNEKDQRWKRLVMIARALDTEPFRDRLRATWGRRLMPQLKDELKQLAESINVRAHSPATLQALAVTLARVGLSDQATRTLEAATAAHPNDFWLNSLLGLDCYIRKDFTRAIRYFSVAVALRPDSAANQNTLGASLLNQKQLAEAATHFRRAIELDPKHALAHNNLGNALAQQGKLDEAIVHCKKAIALDPKYANAHITLGFALGKRGDIDEACAVYRQAIRLKKKNKEEDAQAHGGLGILLCDHKHDYVGAIREFRKAVALDPRNAGWHANLGYALANHGDVDAAIAEYQTAIALGFKSARTYGRLGALLCDKKRDYPGAIAAFRKALDLDAKDADTHRNLGLALKHQGKAAEALAAFRQAVRYAPRYAAAHREVGNLLRDRRDLDGALESFRLAVTFDTKDAAAHNGLGNALFDGGRLDDAIAAYHQAILLQKEDAMYHYNLGNALVKKGLLDRAIGTFKEALRLKKDFPEARIGLGVALARKGRLDDAIAEFRKAIRLKKDDAVAHYNLGRALYDKRQLDDAIAAYEEAIRLKNDYVDAHVSLGNALRDRGRTDEAIAAYRKALQLREDDAAAHNGLGIALQDKGRLDDAIAEHQKAIDLNKNVPEFHNCLGVALAKKRRLDDAIAAFRRAIALAPEHAPAHMCLGNTLHLKRDLEGAIAAYRKAIAIAPNVAMSHYNLANTLRDAGRMNQAVAAYRKAIRLRKDYAEAHINLGLLLKDLGRWEEAIAEFRTVIRLKSDDARTHNSLGVALAYTGQRDAAIAAFRKAIGMDRAFAEPHCCLGIALRGKGLLDDAITEYREAIRLKEDFAEAHHGLANALFDKGLLDEAIAEYRKAIQINKDDALGHCNLGLALQKQCEFRKALAALRRGHELGSRKPGWSYPSGRWVRQCERLVELDGKLPGFLEGKTPPASPEQGTDLARLCVHKRLNRAAVRFFAGAFAAKPKLADDLDSGHRYSAACAAALAGCGQGKDAEKLDGKERARLRRQALDWLRADLQAWGQLLEKGPPGARPTVAQKLRHWLADTDFADVRGREALARLPEGERQPWQKLWRDVADTLARAQGKTTPRKKPDPK
jgi:tetratricopeptide (TPR) repeat protein/serine/threonine protein kinase